MKTKHISSLLLELGIRPSFKGFSTTVHLIGLACRSRAPMQDPNIKELYEETALYFGIKPRAVSDNLKTMLDAYGSQSENLGRFQKLIGYKTDGKLTNKEFVFLIARYLQGREL